MKIFRGNNPQEIGTEIDLSSGRDHSRDNYKNRNRDRKTVETINVVDVVEDFQRKQSSRDRDRDRSTVVEETIQETITRTGTEIDKTVETIKRIEVEKTVGIEIGIDLIQEMEEELNIDLEQVKDALTRMNSATAVTKQVIQHIVVTN